MSPPPSPADTVPYRKTTVSLPSRATAIATSRNRPHQLSLATEVRAPPSSSLLSVRPCFFIQMTICTTRAQAASDMMPWNHSWPSSLSQDEMPSSTSASATASAARRRRPTGQAALALRRGAQPGVQDAHHQQGFDAFAPDDKEDLFHVLLPTYSLGLTTKVPFTFW